LSDKYTLDKLVSAFIGILLLFLVTLLLKESVDAALAVVIYCMALAIPSVCAFFLIDIQKRKLGKTDAVQVSRALTFIVGFGSGFVGIAAIFCHFST
jgi:hypothetical protein